MLFYGYKAFEARQHPCRDMRRGSETRAVGSGTKRKNAYVPAGTHAPLRARTRCAFEIDVSHYSL